MRTRLPFATVRLVRTVLDTTDTSAMGVRKRELLVALYERHGAIPVAEVNAWVGHGSSGYCARSLLKDEGLVYTVRIGNRRTIYLTEEGWIVAKELVSLRVRP